MAAAATSCKCSSVLVTMISYNLQQKLELILIMSD